MIKKALEDIGFTKSEIAVYLNLLKLGESTTGKIVDAAQISSGRIYETLEKLIKKGLVSYHLKNKTKYFTATSPKRILDYINEKKSELNEKEEKFKKELPTLLQLRLEQKKNYENRLYKGFKGIQSAIFEALEELDSKEEVLAMGIVPSKKKHYNILWEKWHRERIKKKIKCKAIFTEKDNQYYHLFQKMENTETKILLGLTPAAVDVLGDRVLIFTYGKEASCLSILNPEIAQSFRTFFMTLWRVSEE